MATLPHRRRAVCMPAAVAVFAALVLGACTTELAEHRDRWETAAVDDYRWKVSAECFGPCGTVVATVVYGEPVAWRYLGSVDGPALDLTREDLDEWSFPPLTVEGLFAEIKQSESEALEIEFDPRLGYPTNISFDYLVDSIDDEVRYTVEFFRAL